MTTETAAKPTTLRARLAPRVMGTQEYIGTQVFVGIVLEFVFTAIIAALATSRATGHRLSATAVAGILIAAPPFNAFISGLSGFFGGVRETARGMVTRDGSEKPSPDADPLTPRALWGRALANSGIAAAWGTGLGFLAYAVLNQRQASYWVLFVGVLAATGVTSVVSSLFGQAQGVRLAFDKPARCRPRSARRRAWLELALPIAAAVATLHALATWVLFHDYAVHAQFGAHILTEPEIFADTITIVAIYFVLAFYIAGRAGEAEARLGLVTFDDRAVQVPASKALFGPQIFAYIALFIVAVVQPLAKLVTPQQPTLVEAMIVRGFMAFVVVYLASAFAYIRAAGNATAAGSDS